MPEDDTPQGTVDGGDDGMTPIDRLADILDDDPETDTAEDEVQAGDTPDDDTEDGGDDATGDGDEEGEETEDSDDDADTGDGDGSDELKGGRFAPHSAKVRLPDGTTTTVEDLMKGGLRQSDYTQKTQGLARERDEFKAERERFNQASHDLQQQRALMDAMLEQWKPKPPDNPREDPVAWMEYQQQEHVWNQWQSQLTGQLQETQSKAQAEQRETMRKHLEAENERLIEAIPAMRDPDKRRRIFDELKRFGSEYGISREEVDAISDHRMIRILLDLQQAKARAAKAPKVVEKVSKKPKVVRGSKRGGQDNSAKRAAMDRLRESGSARDAEAALMNLDL